MREPLRFLPPGDLVQAAFRRQDARDVLWTPAMRERFEDLVYGGKPGPLVDFVRDLFDDTADSAVLAANRGPEPKTLREGA